MGVWLGVVLAFPVLGFEEGRAQALLGTLILALLPSVVAEDMTENRQPGSYIDAELLGLWLMCCVLLQLVAERKIDKTLLPPKKIIGKNSRSLVEKREKDLEVYLQTLLKTFPDVAPRVLAHFLHFHLYVSSFGVLCFAYEPTATKARAVELGFEETQSGPRP